MDNTKLVEVNPYFKQIMEEYGLYSEELMGKIAKKGILKDIPEIPESLKRVFVTAHEISPIWHVKMQAAFQKYTDNAVSKTINFPHNATVEDIRDAYLLAYKLGCKGITVYRDGCREDQVINIGTKVETKDTEMDRMEHNAGFTPRPRPKILFGRTIEMTTGCGKLYVTINYDEKGNPFEIFTSIGKAGGCAQSQCEAMGRLISIIFRSGGTPEIIMKQLKGISCHMKFGFGFNQVLSCADAVAKAIEQSINNPIEVKKISR